MENLTKVCSRCKVEKGVDDFYKTKYLKCGLTSYCKGCCSKNTAKYNRENSEKVKKRWDEWKNNNPEKLKKYKTKWKTSNTEKIKKYYENNADKIKEKSREYYAHNSINVNKCNAEYKKEFIVNLKDEYIKGLLRCQNYPQELINNPEFIEVKRLLIKTKRLCKTSQN